MKKSLTFEELEAEIEKGCYRKIFESQNKYAERVKRWEIRARVYENIKKTREHIPFSWQDSNKDIDDPVYKKIAKSLRDSSVNIGLYSIIEPPQSIYRRFLDRRFSEEEYNMLLAEKA